MIFLAVSDAALGSTAGGKAAAVVFNPIRGLRLLLRSAVTACGKNDSTRILGRTRVRALPGV